jgi:hypothetical protein
MAFEGNIADFGVADVLQLINSQGKTGVLTFQNKKELISIGFENGMICSASHNKRGVLKPIGDYLVLTGKITKEDLRKCDSISKKKGVPLVDTLVENGVLSKEDLEKMIEFKIQEIVDELFTWKNGEYKFLLGERLYSKSKYSVLVNPQFLILEGMRRIDEWPKIKEAIPDSQMVFGKKKRPSLSLEIGEQEKVVIALINGKQCVADIVESCGLGRFRTYHAIYNLLEGGAIEKTAVVVKPKVKKVKIEFSPKIAFSFAAWIFIALFLAINIIVALIARPVYRISKEQYVRRSVHLENYTRHEMSEVEEVYRIRKGSGVSGGGE